MGKAGKWIRILLGKKEKDQHKVKGSADQSKEKRSITTNTATHLSSPLVEEIQGSNTTPVATSTPKEKKRWSFRRSTATRDHHQYMGSMESMSTVTPSMSASFEAESEQKRHALAVAVATAVAADAAVAAAQAAAAVIRMTAAAPKFSAVEETAAVKIQSAFRAFLVFASETNLMYTD